MRSKVTQVIIMFINRIGTIESTDTHKMLFGSLMRAYALYNVHVQAKFTSLPHGTAEAAVLVRAPHCSSAIFIIIHKLKYIQ